MLKRLSEIASLAIMDAVRCTLARIARGNGDAELWLQGAGVDVERLDKQAL